MDMSAAGALKAAREEGVDIVLDGDDLLLEAPSRPRAALIGLLRRHKAEILELLRPGKDGWSNEDWLGLFDERAGIAEFSGGLPREEAEAIAFKACVCEWLNRNPVQSSPSRCVGCGGRDLAHDPVLPFGLEPTGHAWLHSGCWPTWYTGRELEAVRALADMGIFSPSARRGLEPKS
jgi:hypothetical protein